MDVIYTFLQQNSNFVNPLPRLEHCDGMETTDENQSHSFPPRDASSLCQTIHCKFFCHKIESKKKQSYLFLLLNIIII